MSIGSARGSRNPSSTRNDPERSRADLTRGCDGIGNGCVCIQCGTLYHPHLVDWVFCSRRKPVCFACERAGRAQTRQRHRRALKASGVIRRHAERLGIDKELLVTVYGWEPQRLAHDAEHQYGNRCSYCGEPYAGMGRGLADITLDIQDRDRPPYYCTNTKWCCQDCNRKKGAMSPEAFEAYRQMWNLWAKSKRSPFGIQGILFLDELDESA